MCQKTNHKHVRRGVGKVYLLDTAWRLRIPLLSNLLSKARPVMVLMGLMRPVHI